MSTAPWVGWCVYSADAHAEAVRRQRPSMMRWLARLDQVNPKPAHWGWPDQFGEAVAEVDAGLMVTWHGNANSWLPHQAPSPRQAWPRTGVLEEACQRVVEWARDRHGITDVVVQPWNESDLASQLGARGMVHNPAGPWDVNWPLATSLFGRWIRFGVPKMVAGWTGGTTRLVTAHCDPTITYASGGQFYPDWVGPLAESGMVALLDVHCYGSKTAVLDQIRRRLEPWDGATPDSAPLPFVVGEMGTASSKGYTPLPWEQERALLQGLHATLATDYGDRYRGLLYHTDHWQSRIVGQPSGWWET